VSCVPGCYASRRSPAPGAAARVAALLEDRNVDPALLSAWLAAWVGRPDARFRDLCYSHADSVAVGLAKGVLLDDVLAAGT
jgi:hypothetical protein